MTVIVGLVTKTGVLMGADSAGVGGYELTIRKDKKIYQVDDFLFGYTTSFRMGQLLGYSFRPPKRKPRQPVEQYMATYFIDGIRATFKVGGFAKIENGVETGGDFLVAYAGRLFRVCSDFQVGESRNGYDAVGCGADFACGALHASKGQDSWERIRSALKAAQCHSSEVRGPFSIFQQ